MSATPVPACHLAHVPGPVGNRGTHAAVWICEYPYRTMRSSGPSSDCEECPIWQQMQRRRGLASAADEAVLALEALAAS